MEKEKLRSEISDKYKWDLSKIYENDMKWYDEYNNVLNEIKKGVINKEKIFDNGKNLYNFLLQDEKIERLLNKLYMYAHLNYDADTLNNDYQVMFNKISDLFTIYSENTSFFVPSLLKIESDKLNRFYKEEEKLNDYKFYIEKIYRYKDHTLDEEKEKMLSSLSNVFSSSYDTYESLLYSDFKNIVVKDKDNNDLTLTNSNYSLLMQGKDRTLRKNTFNALYKFYEDHKNTLTSTYKGNVELNVVTAKLKKYENAISSSLFIDNVDVSIYNNLIKTVNDNLDVLYKYYDLKKEVLKLDEIHLYDIYANMVDEYNKKYTFDEAKELVINALGVLGCDYVNNLRKAFDEKWIDIYHNKGKVTGAYSSGSYDTKPYVLLNYEGTIDDVSTLAHELGHSMHSYYSNQNNSYINSSYNIFVAEVASTVNELLLSNYMLKNSSSKLEKLSILNHIMELIKATLYRQTMFAEFEMKMHEYRESGEILTSEFLNKKYYELNEKYFGKNVVIDDEIKYEWERIPHFYYNFYVYKYATGISSACFIVNNILNNKPNALENYLSFLKTGGSMYPTDELKVAGVDINDPSVIKGAIKMFDDAINEFKVLIKSK